MTNAQVRRRGAYAPLAATYYTDDDIMEAGEEAELLFVRSLAFCAGNPASDGYVTDKQVARVFGAGMDGLTERIKMLVSLGLWERLPGGYAVRSWLKWNKSAEELGRHRARDRDRKSAKGDTEEGSEPGPDAAAFRGSSSELPSGTAMDSEPPSSEDPDWIPNAEDLDSVPLTQHNTAQQDSQENPRSSPSTPAMVNDRTSEDDRDEDHDPADEEDQPDPRSASYWDRVDLDKDPDFMTFWAAYPRKVAKGSARKAWRSIMKRGGIEASVIIAGAIAYREDPDRKAGKFTAHPASWLNAERWGDYDEDDDNAKPYGTGDPDAYWLN